MMSKSEFLGTFPQEVTKTLQAQFSGTMWNGKTTASMIQSIIAKKLSDYILFGVCPAVKNPYDLTEEVIRVSLENGLVSISGYEKLIDKVYEEGTEVRKAWSQPLKNFKSRAALESRKLSDLKAKITAEVREKVTLELTDKIRKEVRTKLKSEYQSTLNTLSVDNAELAAGLAQKVLQVEALKKEITALKRQLKEGKIEGAPSTKVEIPSGQMIGRVIDID